MPVQCPLLYVWDETLSSVMCRIFVDLFQYVPKKSRIHWDVLCFAIPKPLSKLTKNQITQITECISRINVKMGKNVLCEKLKLQFVSVVLQDKLYLEVQRFDQVPPHMFSAYM